MLAEVDSAKCPKMDEHLRFYRNVTGWRIFVVPIIRSSPPSVSFVALGLAPIGLPVSIMVREPQA